MDALWGDEAIFVSFTPVELLKEFKIERYKFTRKAHNHFKKEQFDSFIKAKLELKRKIHNVKHSLEY